MTDLVPCEQCGGLDRAAVETEWGVLCSVCAYRQAERDDERDAFGGLSATSLGFMWEDE